MNNSKNNECIAKTLIEERCNTLLVRVDGEFKGNNEANNLPDYYDLKNDEYVEITHHTYKCRCDIEHTSPHSYTIKDSKIIKITPKDIYNPDLMKAVLKENKELLTIPDRLDLDFFIYTDDDCFYQTIIDKLEKKKCFNKKLSIFLWIENSDFNYFKDHIDNIMKKIKKATTHNILSKIYVGTFSYKEEYNNNIKTKSIKYEDCFIYDTNSISILDTNRII